ncbi:mRNA-decapping enzyme 1B-like isoform X1 [Hemiscyllium ocellatum]|uniref:mRNA-decapping enzyme 1B-like isoform X1 n=1 Tax=Hemiscyllium ocellatum TaxID=170820 RepID=UPI002966051E|nr:mRNA-decapping enzyme 1B-like isoform X1 [Hemiscyllium ocellatum]
MAAVSGSRGLDISLAALQRQDPYIFRIVDVASQVALYTFSQRDNEWEKTDVEGTLFVYARSASPRHGFTIMNRLNVENRTEPITKDLDFQLQDPFLLYRNAQLSIYGIWFYDEVECQRIAELMKNLTQLEQLKAQQEVGSPISNQNEAVDIVQMLFKAEHEYNKVKLSSEPKQMTSSNLIRNSSNLIKPIPIKLTEFGTDTHYQQVQQQNKSTELGTKHLNLAVLFGTQEKSTLTNVPNETQEFKSKASSRPAVVRSLSYEEPRKLLELETSQNVKKQFCPAIQKLMSRGVDLHPVSELPENHSCENQSERSVEESLAGLFQSQSSTGNISLQQTRLDKSSSLFPKGTHKLLQKLHCTQASISTSCPTVIHSDLFSRTPNGSQMQPVSQSHSAYLSSTRQVQPEMHHVPTIDKSKSTIASNSCTNQIQASSIIPPHELFQKLQIVQQDQQHHAGKMTLAAKFSAQPPPLVNQSDSAMKHFDSQTEKFISSEKPNLLIQAISPQRIPATVIPSLLMSPTVFTQSSVGKPMTRVEASAILLPQTDTIMAPKQLHSGLHSSAQVAELTIKKTHTLTKTQLQETLLYLLQNDPNFVNAIYEAYLTSQSNTSAEKKT